MHQTSVVSLEDVEASSRVLRSEAFCSLKQIDVGIITSDSYFLNCICDKLVKMNDII